jgi:hypothetical protein
MRSLPIEEDHHPEVDRLAWVSVYCRGTLDQEYQQRMEEMLEVLNQPRDEHAPVVALDERPVQLLDSRRPQPRWRHYERIGMRLLTVESQPLQTAKKGISTRLQQSCLLGFNQRRRVGIMISMPMRSLQAV